MKIGLTFFSTDRAVAVADLAREAESRGFYSIYVPEHTHIPTSRRTPAPTGDAELPEDYRRTVDPFVALGAAAALTSRIRLGTAVCLVAQRDPIVTAKEIATLDLLSGGRVVLGIGYGWNREEMENHGVDFRRRWEITREKVLAMQALWTEERAAFEGRYVRLEESWAWPKPLQQPRPPILVGARPGPRLFKHIAEYADGWMPIGGAGVREVLPALRSAFEKAGRDPAELRVVVVGTIPGPGKLDYYESIGVSEVVLRIPTLPLDETLRVLDDYAAAVYTREGPG